MDSLTLSDNIPFEKKNNKKATQFCSQTSDF